MLIKCIIILYLITPDLNYSLSIKKDIDTAKQFLKHHGIPEPDLCTGERINVFCPNTHQEVCSARLMKKRMEFKQFENPCYMDLRNFCESQDNIWSIKNFGPCVMNAELRRFAKEIEKMAANVTNSTELTQANQNKTTDDDRDETTTDDTATAETTPDGETTTDDEEVTETSPDDEIATENNTTDENDETTIADETATDETTTDDNVTEVSGLAEEDDDTANDDNIAEDENATIDDTITDAIVTNTVKTTIADDEIGRIYYDDGSFKSALREGSVATRFPPLKANKSWDRIPCEKRIKCPNIFFPVCLYFGKEMPNNISYYHFINKCEAQQWTCYHPERKVEGSSSMRAGFCAHIQESMRMYPSLGFLTRRCVDRYSLPDTGVTIHRGVGVIVPIHALQNDERYFQEPSEFRPERFSPENMNNIHNHVYLPFGEGPRACIGERLGLMQSLAGLAALLRRCSVAPGARTVRAPITDPGSTVTQIIRGGLPLALLAREHRTECMTLD